MTGRTIDVSGHLPRTAGDPLITSPRAPGRPAPAGRALVNLNSGTPKEAHAAASWAAERGVAYLDGAVMVPPPLVEQAPDLGAGHYPGDLGTLHMNLNALEHIALTCEEQGVHTAQPRLMREIAARAIEDRHGASNYLAVFEVFKKAAEPDAR
ncbi:hypothetical protein QC334_11125 [Streptomyces sp. DH18]|uniref:imine reductase family protein n=1 Tax=Streptomyces sp. DH18 TaxID=3040126 RepID=UPI002442F357|nr:hypothetical protein [Streptomyces sp. DH18]MDG9683281.1 hypothetical protein [Streptomyces sp. DH18]